MKTPYPGRYESHESWMSRCDAAERQQRAENEERYNSAPNGRGLTEKQKAKLAKVEAKLPEGWSYWVTNDNRQIGLFAGNSSTDAFATKEGKFISGMSSVGAIGALLINRACAAVWGQQPVWWNGSEPIFTAEEWNAATKELKK